MIEYLSRWKFYDYVEGESTPFGDWYEELSDAARLKLDALLKDNRKIEIPLNWTGLKGFLRGKYRPERIWELAFKADKRQYRVLGIFGSRTKQAILLVGCFHKGGIYTPRDALDTACRRAKAIRAGTGGTRERQIRDDI